MTRTVSIPVSLELFKEAMEYYWRSQTTIKLHEDVKIIVPCVVEEVFPATLTITIEEDKGVEGKLVHGKDG